MEALKRILDSSEFQAALLAAFNSMVWLNSGKKNRLPLKTSNEPAAITRCPN